jgi:endopeptidase Clp ATP-binding regulatory subunit ClpX
MNRDKIPNQEEIQQDIKKLLEEKYGAKVAFAEPDYIGSKAGTNTSKAEDLDQIRFDMKPEELEKYLKMYVVGQEEAIEVLATKICTHFHRMRFERENPKEEEIVGHIKSNILLIGPTGVGKTYIVKMIAHKIGVPFVKGDATKFSETGYVGGDVEDLVRDLVQEAKGNIKLAEYGIIYIDEIDKIASSQGHWGPDVSRTGVQRNLLKLMEETEVDLKVPHDLASQMEAVLETQKTGKAPRKKVNTKNILFVVSGAFNKLDEIVRKRLKSNKIGFLEEGRITFSGDDYLNLVRTEDLIQYGFESEFVGRLPIIARLKELGVEGLYQILKNARSSVISSKKRDFKAYGIELEFEDEALREIAIRADKEKTGARGLVSVMEKALTTFEKKFPSTNIKHLLVTKDLVENPQQHLKKMVFDDIITSFQRDFLLDNGLVLEFTPKAKKQLEEKYYDGENLQDFLRSNFKDYSYGLKLIGAENFKINSEVLQDPIQYLNVLIKKSYGKDKKL